MSTEPQKPASPADRIGYRIAVGAVGVGLVAFLIGAAVIAANGIPVPTQYWSTGSAIAGALLGILAPTPVKPNAIKHEQLKEKRREEARRGAEAATAGAAPPAPQVPKVKEVDQWPSPRDVLGGIVVALEDLWTNRALLILLFVFVVTLILSITSNSAQLQAVAAAAGGALVGLLVPPPSSGSS